MKFTYFWLNRTYIYTYTLDHPVLHQSSPNFIPSTWTIVPSRCPGTTQLMWVRQCHLHHPPIISIFIAGVNNSQSWVVYYYFNHIKSTTANTYIYISLWIHGHCLRRYLTVQIIPQSHFLRSYLDP